MVSTCDYKSRLGNFLGNQIKSLDHEFKTLVGTPFSKRQNAMDGSASPREIGEFGAARKNAMRPQVNVVSPILVVQDFAVTGHEHRDGVREQQHARRHRTGE